MEIREKFVTDSDTDGTHRVVEKRHLMSSYAENPATFIVWRIASVLMVLLSIRFVFKLLGANTTGIVKFFYDITEPFVAPFRGIFASPTTDGSYFESATVVAIIMIAVLAWVIASLININRPSEEV